MAHFVVSSFFLVLFCFCFCFCFCFFVLFLFLFVCLFVFFFFGFGFEIRCIHTLCVGARQLRGIINENTRGVFFKNLMHSTCYEGTALAGLFSGWVNLLKHFMFNQVSKQVNTFCNVQKQTTFALLSCMKNFNNCVFFEEWGRGKSYLPIFSPAWTLVFLSLFCNTSS